VGDGLGVALPLEAYFVGVDGPRGIGEQDELEVHLLRGGRGGESQGEGDCDEAHRAVSAFLLMKGEAELAPVKGRRAARRRSACPELKIRAVAGILT
jgi:hypothetical protein